MDVDSWSRDDPSRPMVDSYRRRSPDRRDRRRSRSPKNIDRYQPGDRAVRDDHYRARDDFHRRRSSPPPVRPDIDRYVPGQEPTPMAKMTNPVPNPMSLEYQVGFNFFAEWWRIEQMIKDEKEREKNGGRRPDRLRGDRETREERAKERELIQAAYDQYKEKLQVQMAKSFVQQHKGEEWFRERYDEETRAKLRAELNEYRRALYSQWRSEIDGGVFDDFTLEGIYKNESDGAGGIVEKEEGEAVAANEVLGVGDLLPVRGGDLRDESAMQPTLLIKTIAPTVSREKMEAFCKEHLGEGEGGFKWLSLSDPNPLKKCHRIGWVLLNPSSEQPAQPEEEVLERSDGRDDDGELPNEPRDEGQPSAPSDPETPALATCRKALAEINGKTIHDEARGDFTCHVGVHEPPATPRKKALWDLFSAPERVERDLQLATRLAAKLDEELGDEFQGVSAVQSRVEELRSKGWLQPPANATSSSKKVKPDPDEMEDGEEGAIDEEDEGAIDDEVDDEELLAKKKELDLLVEYLRRVFNFCFFCVFESDSVHELTRKCPGGHLRRPRASLTTAAKATARASASGEPFPLRKQEQSMDGEDGSPAEERKPQYKVGSKSQQQLQRAYNWVKTYEDKLLQILEPESVDLRKIGGKPTDDAVEEELVKFVKQEDESKFRCKVPDCSKLFKGEVFWRKHVEKRHEEWYEKLKQDLDLVNKYVLDPAHIAPSRSDANSNGHFPLNNHQPTGTPRGFNLASMPGMMMGNGVPNPVSISQLFAQGGLNMANFPMGIPGFGDGDSHMAGPMRRGGNRFNSRQSGPYDRQSKDARNQRWANSGRLTPPRGMNGRGGGNARFAEGGSATVGPQEAVRGRSLKSYEDLDAAGGGGTGELNY